MTTKEKIIEKCIKINELTKEINSICKKIINNKLNHTKTESKIYDIALSFNQLINMYDEFESLRIRMYDENIK